MSTRPTIVEALSDPDLFGCLEMDGPSSSMIVAVPVGVATVALVGLESVTVNVSFTSSTASLMTGTDIVWFVWPGSKVRTPLVAV